MSGPWEKYQTAAPAAGPWSKYGPPPTKENSGDAASQRNREIGAANVAANATEQGPVQDVIDMASAIPQGAGHALTGIGTTIEHPIEAASALWNKGRSAIDAGISAIQHPIDTTQKVGDYLKGVKPQQVGEMIGSTAVGGVAGKAAGVVGDVVGPSIKALQKPVSPAVRDLANKGVVMTPGMRGGKVASALEQRATSIPLVGDMIQRARGKTTEQWNRAELNEAIKDAGGTAIPAGRTGRDAIFHAEQQMGSAYDRVLSKMSGDLNSANQSGVSFRHFLDQTKQLSAQGLEPSAAKIVGDNVNKVIAKFDSAGKVSGETVKEIQETLRTEIDALKGGSYQERKAAEALKGVSADMKAMLKRENPVLAPQLDNIDRGYAKFKASSKASLYATKNQGTYTPAQKLQAIKARDKSKDKQRTASGQAHGQKDAEAVEAVIGNTEPDSGSAGRIATMEALLGGGGLAAGHPLAAAAAVGAPLMYSQPVLKLLQNRALKKGGAYRPVSGKKAATVGALLAERDQ